MPELPEIESLRLRLTPHLVGRRLEGLEVLDAKEWRPHHGLTAGDAVGRTVRRIERRAKALLFVLEDVTLLVHLKMSGQLVLDAPDSAREGGGFPYDLTGVALPGPITRFALRFDGGALLCVNDRRRFAWLRLLRNDGVAAYLAAQRYGPDPLSPEFSPALLATRLWARRRRSIKAALLDQTCLAGLGSIYADEALHRAGIHPATGAGALTAAQIAALHRGILDALADAVAAGGAVVLNGRAYATGEAGGTGGDLLRVHGRGGLPCVDCAYPGTPSGGNSTPESLASGRAVIRTMVGGRTTYLCPVCQPFPGAG